MNIKNTLKKTKLFIFYKEFRKEYFYFIIYPQRRRIVKSQSPEALIRHVWNQRRRGFTLDLNNPKSFQEKMQWLKLYWYDNTVIQCANKYHVREYVVNKGLGFLLNDLFGVYKNPDEIDFEILPDSFVLKTSHAGAQVIICKNKAELNITRVKRILKKWLELDYQYFSGEWCYASEKLIVCEKYLVNNNKDGLIDYKLFCFNGRVDCLFVTLERFGENKNRIWFDRNWNPLKIKVNDGSKNNRKVAKPDNFDKMVEYAEILSKPFPFVRVDFYSVNNNIIFGELTFASDSGFNTYYPNEFEFELGNKLILPSKSIPNGWEVILNDHKE